MAEETEQKVVDEYEGLIFVDWLHPLIPTTYLITMITHPTLIYKKEIENGFYSTVTLNYYL